MTGSSAGPGRAEGGNIVLIGFMGTGKSSIGRRIAQRLGYRFADTDQLVAQKAGCSISDIFEARGEESFRDAESAALASLREAGRHVIATGGGIVDRAANTELLRAMGFVVWFSASEEVILERVSRNDKRPLLRGGDPRETIRRLLERRAPAYARAAHFTIDTSLPSHDEIALAVLDAARHHFQWPLPVN